MHQYELMVILDPEIDERTVAPSLDKFLNVVRNDGGTIDNVDIWGRRRLAYEINKKAEGIYAVVNFTANPDATVELDRQLKLSEAVMRTKVLRAEEAIAMVAEAEKLAGISFTDAERSQILRTVGELRTQLEARGKSALVPVEGSAPVNVLPSASSITCRTTGAAPGAWVSMTMSRVAAVLSLSAASRATTDSRSPPWPMAWSSAAVSV